MPWMPCKDWEHCLYKNCSSNEYPCVLCCKGIDKYDMWKSARMKEADNIRDYEAAIEQIEYNILYESTYNPDDGSM